ncbi:MAG: D-alanyl-D-alanine carboxypeptidase [Alphaproteobacteria bacterium]
MAAAVAMVFVLAAPNPAAARPSYASIVVDWQTGRVISNYRADKLHAPASLTKVMTLYLLFEALDAKRIKLNQRLRVSRHAQYTSPSRLGLRAGTTITVREAILALVTKSANDAAVVVAEALGGSEARFARMMTIRARQIGMTRTTFRNASGLPARGQLTTARDMAIMARTIIKKFPHHYHYFGTRVFYFRGRRYGNHNRLLGRYPGVDGLKTGYVRASGYNLIVSARNRAGTRVVAVVLGGRSHRHRDIRMTSLLNHSFGSKTRYASLIRRGRHVMKGRTQRKASAFATARTYKAARYTKHSKRSVRRHSSRRHAVRRGRWSVQVGAFRSYRRAKRATYLAKRRARTLRRAVPTVIKVRRSRYRYRARLRGLTRKQAYIACRSLKRNGKRCAVRGPSRS